jgi:hypothetical protein
MRAYVHTVAMMKKHSTYRLSDKAKTTIAFLKDKQYGKDATHIIECALAQAEALWHMRDKLNTDQNALQHVEIGISEQKAKAPLLRSNGRL